jgi:2-polyprenyl-6-methoxyphenol hydroxylase-like FAD-dependent oxidoreductase
MPGAQTMYGVLMLRRPATRVPLSSPLGEHAVVLGGSVAGLLAARVLADHFQRVSIIERDSFAELEPAHRKGTPQSHHQHILLARGRQIFEQLFPGFDAELGRMGAPLADYTGDCILHSAAGRVPQFVSGLELRLCRRPLIDWVLLQRLRSNNRIQFHERTKVTGLITDNGFTRVTGVKLESGANTSSGPPGELLADYVIDATGRGSKLPAWLEALDYRAPREQVINAFLGYASRLYRKPTEQTAAWKAIEIACRPLQNPRAAGMWEVDSGRWLLTLIGTARTYPATTEAGFLEFARLLPEPIVYETIRNAEPISPIHGYRGTENRFRHYEELRRFPEQLAVLGDAMCAFNPTYGQGMTVAAMSALELDQLLGQVRTRHDMAAIGPRLHRRIAKLVQPAWLLAITEDMRWPTTEGASPSPWTRAAYWYVDRLTQLATTTPLVVEEFLSVANMIRPSHALVRPAILARVARAELSRLFVKHDRIASHEDRVDVGL